MQADIATLLAEAPWLARLARSLTGDPAEADDLVQETYAAALRSPPETDRPVRPWLRRVAVNLARMRHRSRVRRVANESVVETSAEPVHTPEQLVERARLERRLAELVLELDEPFRTTVLMRYRVGLSAEQIAKEQGIPAGTVRRRLKTALDRLRGELDDRDRTRMYALFAPLAAAQTQLAPDAALWRILMAKLTSKVAVVLVVLLLLIGGGVFLLSRNGSSSAGPPGESGHVPASAAEQRARTIARPAMFAQSGVAARRVRGRVTLDGAPYPGADVRLLHAQTSVLLAETKSSADGSFDMGDRVADVYMVTASAPDHAALPVRVDLRAPSEESIELRLTGCSHVRGTIVDGSGAPIGHARIAREDAPVPFAESDASGRYDLCTHYGTTQLRYSASGYQSVLAWLEVAANTTRDMVLIPEATVEGTVVTADGKPVADAWVVVAPSALGRERSAPATGFSDADGAFRIAGVSPGRNFVSGFAPGLRSTHEQELVVGSGQGVDGVIVRLEPAGRIAGVVVAGDKPVAGAGVGMRVGNRDQGGVLAVTQADGSFVIDRAPRGSVALYVEGYTVIAPRSLTVGDEPSDVRIEVDRLGGVHGRVLRDGQPVSDAQVTCFRMKVFTEASGEYTCDGVDPGPQEVYADTPSGAWGYGKVTVTRGETAQLDISLAFSAAICGTVVDERGAPVAGVEVRVGEKTTGDFGKDTTAPDGAFCTRILTGGTYDVSVFGGARELELVSPVAAVTLGPTETRRDVRISVTAPRLSITGIVSDPHGAPIVDATVRALAANKAGIPTFDIRTQSVLALTDEAGHFEVGKLAAGDYTLIATARDGSEVTKSPVPAGSRDVAITVEPAGRIEGRIVGFATPPTITAVMMAGGHFAVDAEVDGDRFRASGLPPGTYVLTAVTGGHEGDTQQVDVRPGQTAIATMTSRGTATLTGVARDYRTRAPVPAVRCDTMTRHGEMSGAIYIGPDHGVVADAHGAFRLTAPAGEIVIICDGGSASGQRNLVLPRDRTTTADVMMVAHTQTPGTIDAHFEIISNRIRELTKGGAADRAGLRVGDEVIEVDGVSVVDVGAQDTMLVITQRPAGAIANLTIVRDGAQHAVAVTVRGANR